MYRSCHLRLVCDQPGSHTGNFLGYSYKSGYSPLSAGYTRPDLETVNMLIINVQVTIKVGDSD